MQLNAGDIEFLLALFERESLSATARHFAQPISTLSRRLAALRKAFDDELFVRMGTGMQPTPFAEAIRPEFVTIYRALVNMFVREAFVPETCRKRFRIASIDLPVVTYGPPLLAALRRAAPNTAADFTRIGPECLTTSLPGAST